MNRTANAVTHFPTEHIHKFFTTMRHGLWFDAVLASFKKQRLHQFLTPIGSKGKELVSLVRRSHRIDMMRIRALHNRPVIFTIIQQRRHRDTQRLSNTCQSRNGGDGFTRFNFR